MYGEGAGQFHIVRNLTLRMGAAVARAEVAFGVAYNGQDYYPNPAQAAAQGLGAPGKEGERGWRSETLSQADQTPTLSTGV